MCMIRLPNIFKFCKIDDTFENITEVIRCRKSKIQQRLSDVVNLRYNRGIQMS
jgi:hypothetical protein